MVPAACLLDLYSLSACGPAPLEAQTPSSLSFTGYCPLPWKPQMTNPWPIQSSAARRAVRLLCLSLFESSSAMVGCRYLENVPAIVPLLEKEYRNAARRLEDTQDELNDLHPDKCLPHPPTTPPKGLMLFPSAPEHPLPRHHVFCHKCISTAKQAGLTAWISHDNAPCQRMLTA